MVGYLLFVILKVDAPYFNYLFSIVEFCFFTWFFYLIINNPTLKKILPILAIAFVVFSLIDYFLLRNENAFNSTSAGIEAVLIIAMCIYYFFDQLKQPNTLLIYSSINFWVIISFLIYVSGTFFLYIYADSMIDDRSFIKQYIIINSSFNILKNILFAVAMIMKPEIKSTQNNFPEESLNADWNSNPSIQHLN